VLPSPNIPTLDSCIVYPGTVLFEGTNVSEGRGTTKPFELLRAPWVHSERFADGMNALAMPGVRFRPSVIEPTFHKHAQTSCGGCQIHVLDRETFRPVEAGVALIAAFRAADAERFRWRDPPYEYEHTLLPIDILAGSSETREQIEAGQSARDIARSWEPGVAAFTKQREPFLLYSPVRRGTVFSAQSHGRRGSARRARARGARRSRATCPRCRGRARCA